MNHIPLFVKILGILYYICAGFSVLSGILFLFGADTINSFFGAIPLISIIGLLGSGIFIFAAFLFFAVAVLNFFIGRGLLNKKNWARILVIVFSVIGVLMGISSLSIGTFLNGIITLVISGGIGGYLLFNKEAKKFFKG